MRVESSGFNYMIASHRYAALVKFLQDSRDDANAVLNVLARQGLVPNPSPSTSSSSPAGDPVPALPLFQPDAKFRALTRYNGMPQVEAELLFTPWAGPVQGRVSWEEFMHPDLASIAEKMNLTLPIRDGPTLTMSDITMTQLHVQTGGYKTKSKKQNKGQRPQVTTDYFMSQDDTVTLLNAISESSELRNTLLFVDWTAVSQVTGIDRKKAEDRWRTVKTWKTAALHLLSHHSFTWDTVLHRPVAPLEVWREACENNARPAALQMAVTMHNPFIERVCALYGQPWHPPVTTTPSSLSASAQSTSNATTDNNLQLEGVLFRRTAWRRAKDVFAAQIPEGWTRSEYASLVDAIEAGAASSGTSLTLQTPGFWRTVARAVRTKSVEECKTVWSKLRYRVMLVRRAMSQSPGLRWDTASHRLSGDEGTWLLVSSGVRKDARQLVIPLRDVVERILHSQSDSSDLSVSTVSLAEVFTEAVGGDDWTDEERIGLANHARKFMSPGRMILKDGTWDAAAEETHHRRTAGSCRAQWASITEAYAVAKAMISGGHCVVGPQGGVAVLKPREKIQARVWNAVLSEMTYRSGLVLKTMSRTLFDVLAGFNHDDLLLARRTLPNALLSSTTATHSNKSLTRLGLVQTPHETLGAPRGTSTSGKAMAPPVASVASPRPSQNPEEALRRTTPLISRWLYGKQNTSIREAARPNLPVSPLAPPKRASTQHSTQATGKDSGSLPAARTLHPSTRWSRFPSSLPPPGAAAPSQQAGSSSSPPPPPPQAPHLPCAAPPAQPFADPSASAQSVSAGRRNVTHAPEAPLVPSKRTRSGTPRAFESAKRVKTTRTLTVDQGMRRKRNGEELEEGEIDESVESDYRNYDGRSRMTSSGSGSRGAQSSWRYTH